MKNEIKKYLKENGHPDLFSEERYATIKEYMKLASKKNLPLKTYLSFDPLNKVKFVGDHIIKFYERISTS